jgi:hypothetical protein
MFTRIKYLIKPNIHTLRANAYYEREDNNVFSEVVGVKIWER